MKGVFLFFLSLFLVLPNAQAGKIKKGFKALEIYNYFESKQLFENSLKKEIVPSAYGLSLIYLRTDNPFHNLDSAYNYIVKAVQFFPDLNLQERLEYAIYGCDSIEIFGQREFVSSFLFLRAKKENSVQAFENFISKNHWSTNVDSAVFLRDQLAFEKADSIGTSLEYNNFLSNYPTSYFANDANSRFEKSLYLENTASNTLTAYVEFVRKYPENLYLPDAEDQIFSIYTKTGSVESYKKFIRDFPENRNVNLAWRKLYNAHFQKKSYDSESIQAFKLEFPDYPYQKELEAEMELANTIFYPIKVNQLWGFIDEDGKVTIQPNFQDAENFSEGLALVKLEGKYGYVNKSGKLVVAAEYDDALAFNEGHAVVELKDKLGMINRNGEFIIPPRYEDLGNLENGLSYFLLDSLYGYFDAKGIERIKPKYTEASDFENGKSIVSIDDFYGLIDVFGTTFIAMKYQGLRHYHDDIYLAMQNDYWGLIQLNGDTILPFIYDYISKISNNRILIEKEGEFNYTDLNGHLLLTTWIPVYSEFKQLATFKNGYAKIKFEGKFNLIDTTGKKLFAQPKENIGDYSSLIAVNKSDKWGYVNPAGAQIIPYNFTWANSFEGNYAIAGNDPFFGLINKQGKYVVNPYFEQLTFLNDSLLIAKSLGNYGIISIDGDTLLNFVYLSIEPISEKVVRIEQGGAIFYYDLVLNKIMKKEEE